MGTHEPTRRKGSAAQPRKKGERGGALNSGAKPRIAPRAERRRRLGAAGGTARVASAASGQGKPPRAGGGKGGEAARLDPCRCPARGGIGAGAAAQPPQRAAQAQRTRRQPPHGRKNKPQQAADRRSAQSGGSATGRARRKRGRAGKPHAPRRIPFLFARAACGRKRGRMTRRELCRAALCGGGVCAAAGLLWR